MTLIEFTELLAAWKILTGRLSESDQIQVSQLGQDRRCRLGERSVDVPVCGSLSCSQGSLAAPRFIYSCQSADCRLSGGRSGGVDGAAWIPNLVYAFMIPGILKNRYREKGYEEIE